MDHSYQHIKRKLLEKLNTFDCQVIYSSVRMIDKWNHKDRENTYIKLLNNIVSSIDDDVLIITFDAFGNSRFEQDVINRIQNN